MVQVSPGVVSNILDFSDYAERVSSSILGIVGWANRGPIDKPTLISNERQLIETFGKPPAPISDAEFPAEIGQVQYRSQGLITPAIQFLRNGNQLIVVRAASSSAEFSSYNAQGSSTNRVTFRAISEGTWTSAANQNIELKFDSASKLGAEATDYFKVTIRESGVVKEVYDNVTNVSARIALDPDNSVEARINGVSQYVTAIFQSDGNPSDDINTGNWYGLTGGNDGVPGAADYQSKVLPDGRLGGLGALADGDKVTINLIACPGVAAELSDANKVVETALLEVAKTRGDCLALIDPSNTAQNPQQAREFINGKGSFGGASMNSSFAAYYWPWVKVYDAYNKQQVWTPPSGVVAGAMAFNDRVSQPWFAPAGLTRGGVSYALDIGYNTTLGEREALYASGEVVNPIVNFPGDGVAIFGQKTTQRNNSALNRVNVRRLLNYATKIISTSTRVLLFEPNDSRTWTRFRNLVNPILDQIKTDRGLIDFKVICDQTTNTPALIDQGRMRAILLLKPTKAAEIIEVDFTVLSTGVEFNEFEA